ncbi:Nn.00g035540.m01.CDS01 [Neocucurbitaria sp. VM-36]
MRKLAADLMLLDARVRTITHTEYHSTGKFPEPSPLGTTEALQWAFDLVQWTNRNLQEHIEQRSSPKPEWQSQPDASPSMRRGQHHLEEREEQSSPIRQYPTVHHGMLSFTHPGIMSEDSRRNPYGNETTPMGNSPHHTTSSSGSIFMPPQSPMQAPQPMRSAILPSPSSLNFPNAPYLPSISPPTTSVQTSAQSAHLQDLQHQISVKTLAFQTLQREYDSLLQKLERQRTKCATLEKKFEVSDVEINSLTDEKEKLQRQITTMEGQVEELQQSRDEARRQLVANGAQYMRIMEMANRLQAQGAEDKKKWEAERTDLEQRIRLLEEAMVTGTEHPAPEAVHHSSNEPALQSIALPHNPASSRPSQAETINILRVEVSRLRSRTQTLETALQTMRQESISIQAAAQQLVESGSKLENVAQIVVGRGG